MIKFEARMKTCTILSCAMQRHKSLTVCSEGNKFPKKNQFLIFDHSYVKWFYSIDDKHIVINNESPFRLLSIHRATFQSIFRNLPPSSIRFSLLPGCFSIQELNQIKVKINLLRIRKIYGFIYSIERHIYCCLCLSPISSIFQSVGFAIDMQLCTTHSM